MPARRFKPRWLAQGGGNEDRAMHSATIGLALGSGAARGWAHIGIIEALEEAGIKPDIVCGSSVGALVGATYVAGGLPALKRWALDLNWRQILGLLDFRVTGGGLINGRLITRKLSDFGVDAPIEDYPIAFAAVAAELSTGHEVWIREGPIDEAVRASIALPGILSPTRINDRWLVDGGLVNPVPVSACRALGAEIIIAVNLNGDFFEVRGSPTAVRRQRRLEPAASRKAVGRFPAGVAGQASLLALRLLQPSPAAPGYFDVLVTAIQIMQDQITRSRLAGEPPQVLLVPKMADIGPMDFNRARRAIDEGRAAVEHALPALRRATKAP